MSLDPRADDGVPEMTARVVGPRSEGDLGHPDP